MPQNLSRRLAFDTHTVVFNMSFGRIDHMLKLGPREAHFLLLQCIKLKCKRSFHKRARCASVPSADTTTL